MTRIDVSMPLSVGMPAFPGDPEFDSAPVRQIARGDAYNISRLTFGSHAGTHVDPPVHFVPGGATIDHVDLELLNGPCQVVGVADSSTSIGAAEVARIPSGTTRVLFRSSNSARWAERLEFFGDYVALDLSAAQALLDRGVRLVGIDALSIERDLTETYPVHHELLRRGALILEGLLLGDAPPGPYDLACLPLRVSEGDGGPARVTLARR
jgi:arylformamidase